MLTKQEELCEPLLLGDHNHCLVLQDLRCDVHSRLCRRISEATDCPPQLNLSLGTAPRPRDWPSDALELGISVVRLRPDIGSPRGRAFITKTWPARARRRPAHLYKAEFAAFSESFHELLEGSV